MTIIIDILNSINKLLGYLNINSKYLNRLYTILSILPTLYIIRIIYGLYLNQKYVQMFLYFILLVGLIYFIVLNFIYYFKNKNVKWDITQLLNKYLPDEVFILEEEVEDKDTTFNITGITQKIDLVDNSELLIQKNIEELIVTNKIIINDLTKKDGYLIPKGTLYPFYLIIKDEDKYCLKIGTSYDDLETIGYINNKEFKSLGLYILGGKFKLNGVEYKEKYKLNLKIQKSEDN